MNRMVAGMIGFWIGAKMSRLENALSWKSSPLEFGFWATNSKFFRKWNKRNSIVQKGPLYIIEMGFSVLIKYKIIKGRNERYDRDDSYLSIFILFFFSHEKPTF